MTPATTSDEIRLIEAEAAPTRFARGWHCLGLTRDLADGTPHTINAFGQKLVVFASADGELNVLDAYCRHMGADLSRGTVKGNEIACPFHDWRWGGDGRCKQIPYSRRVPLRARTAAWPTLVQDGMLFVWNDPEGNPPIAEQAIPRIEAFGDSEWTDWRWYEQVVETNAREVMDNVVDMAHFFYVHYAFPTRFSNVFENHVATQFMDGVFREDVMPEIKDHDVHLKGNSASASYFGPSFMITDLTYHYAEFDLETVLINCHYPISDNAFMLMSGLLVKRNPQLLDDAADEFAAQMGEFIQLGFQQDVEIWKSKARIDNPLLCEEDGPVYQLRRWYEQFYVDVADIKPEMIDRFEFEIDTSKPNEAWHREVEQNLAALAEHRTASASAPR